MTKPATNAFLSSRWLKLPSWALKREFMLFRVINDIPGDSARVVKLLEWNLEQFPYFVETELISGDILIDWADPRGGLASIAIEKHREVVARIVSALAQFIHRRSP